ncbi:MAG: 4-(cytidine 5'-diphospho)-2-C-methyl-D-erythritol kinase [Herminiimonas sp.]|nr:4-(cytidine 5'-diphospho)-2-C-methyl-D-erythritol kinase [Herminiimonas sp.]
MTHCAAPAKLNLFLHVTGRRADGYHLLQTVFQLIDHGDLLHFTRRDDSVVRRIGTLAGVAEADDLTVRAARLLQAEMARRGERPVPGADIEIDKRLPMGGGLGGGSSDAATTLMVLNHLWDAGLSRQALMVLGLRLGADVPFFIFGQNAFAEGVGEALVSVETPDCWYVVIEPAVMVPTSTIFNSTRLTRDTKAVRIADFSRAPIGFGKNDLQEVAATLHAPIAAAVVWLGNFGETRMTGSGACVFSAFDNQAEADAAVTATRAMIADAAGNAANQAGQWQVWRAKALKQHPLQYLQQS